MVKGNFWRSFTPNTGKFTDYAVRIKWQMSKKISARSRFRLRHVLPTRPLLPWYKAACGLRKKGRSHCRQVRRVHPADIGRLRRHAHWQANCNWVQQSVHHRSEAGRVQNSVTPCLLRTPNCHMSLLLWTKNCCARASSQVHVPFWSIHLFDERELPWDFLPTGEKQRWTYGIYQQPRQDGRFCNYAARARWTYKHHLSVLIVNQMDEVPFCFICSVPGEQIMVWFSEDSVTRVREH